MCDCGKATRDLAYSCDDCADRTARRLGEVPWVVGQLEITLAKEHGIDYSDHSGGCAAVADEDEKKVKGAIGATESALPYHLGASVKLGALRHALVMAVKFCDEEGIRHQSPSNDYPADDLLAMARWLLWRVDGLTLNDMGGEILADITNAVAACKRIIDSPPERKYAGPCPECSRDLYHRPDAKQVECRGCGSRWDVGEVNAWMQARLDEHLTDRLVTAKEGATLLSREGYEITQRIIDGWRERKHISEAGTTQGIGGKEKLLYRWDELRILAMRHAQRQALQA